MGQPIFRGNILLPGEPGKILSRRAAIYGQEAQKCGELVNSTVACYEAIDNFVNPKEVTHFGWLAAAGIIGFLGKEAVAVSGTGTGPLSLRAPTLL